jgi:hypothetical protein
MIAHVVATLAERRVTTRASERLTLARSYFGSYEDGRRVFVIEIVGDRVWAAPKSGIAIRWARAFAHESLHFALDEIGEEDAALKLDRLQNGLPIDHSGLWEAVP